MDSSVGFVALIPILFFLLWLVMMVLIFSFVITAITFWVWMLVDCLKTTPEANNEKLMWVLIIVLANWVGALVYYFMQRPKNRTAAMIEAGTAAQGAG